MNYITIHDTVNCYLCDHLNSIETRFTRCNYCDCILSSKEINFTLNSEYGTIENCVFHTTRKINKTPPNDNFEPIEIKNDLKI